MTDAFNAIVGFRVWNRLAIAEMYKGIANTANFRAGNGIALVDGFGDREKVVSEGIGKKARVERIVVE